MTTLCPHCQTSQNVVDGKIEEHDHHTVLAGVPTTFYPCPGSGQPVQPAETPETDAHEIEQGFEIAAIYVGRHVHPDFARNLERQRNAALASEKELREALIECASTLQSVAKVIPDMPQTKMLLKFEGEEKYREVSYQDAVTETLEFASKALIKPTP